MRRWWKNRKYDVIAWLITTGLILAVLGIIVACAYWIAMQPVWDYQFDKWLKTASVGEVLVVFGVLFVSVRLLSNPSLVVKKND